MQEADYPPTPRYPPKPLIFPHIAMMLCLLVSLISTVDDTVSH